MGVTCTVQRHERSDIRVSNLKNAQCFRKELWFVLMIGSFAISKRLV